MFDCGKPESAFNPSIYLKHPSNLKRRKPKKAKEAKANVTRPSGKITEFTPTVRCTRCIDSDRECGGLAGRRCAPCIKAKKGCSFSSLNSRIKPSSGHQSPLSTAQDDIPDVEIPSFANGALTAVGEPAPSPEPPSEEGEELSVMQPPQTCKSTPNPRRSSSQTSQSGNGKNVSRECLVPEVIIVSTSRSPIAPNKPPRDSEVMEVLQEGNEPPRRCPTPRPSTNSTEPAPVPGSTPVKERPPSPPPSPLIENSDALSALIIREGILRQKYEHAKVKFEQAKVEMELKAGEMETLKAAVKSVQKKKAKYQTSEVIKIEL